MLAIPPHIGVSDGTRTRIESYDSKGHNLVSCQLDYTHLVTLTGFEPVLLP